MAYVRPLLPVSRMILTSRQWSSMCSMSRPSSGIPRPLKDSCFQKTARFSFARLLRLMIPTLDLTTSSVARAKVSSLISLARRASARPSPRRPPASTYVVRSTSWAAVTSELNPQVWTVPWKRYSMLRPAGMPSCSLTRLMSSWSSVRSTTCSGTLWLLSCAFILPLTVLSILS